MIDRKSLDLHPASRLEARCLERLGVAPDPAVTPLVQLLGHLSRSRTEDGLRARAAELSQLPPDQAVAFLVPDPQELRLELAGVGDRWPVLEGHLNSLLADLKRAPKVSDVGAVLAENLLNSLGLAV
jgi:hypothetical protein